jgi:hypothetical protein
MRRLMLTLLAAAMLAAPPTLAKTPSFASWMQQWLAQHIAANGHLLDSCVKRYGDAQDRVGECYVKGTRADIRRERPKFARGIVQILRGQPARCTQAVHAYVLASRRTQTALLKYLDSHTHADIETINQAAREQPYAGWYTATVKARQRAIRVCG